MACDVLRPDRVTCLALGQVQQGDQGRLGVGRAQLEGLVAVAIAQLGGDHAVQTLQVVAQ